MWDSSQIEVVIDEVQRAEIAGEIVTPAGTIRFLASVSMVDRVLYLDGVHIGVLYRGALCRAGLNAILRKVLEETDADKVVIQGGTRTTGRYRGRIPRKFCFPHD